MVASSESSSASSADSSEGGASGAHSGISDSSNINSDAHEVHVLRSPNAHGKTVSSLSLHENDVAAEGNEHDEFQVDASNDISTRLDVEGGLEDACFVQFLHARKVYRETIHCFSSYARDPGWCF